ncbi:hypothetical protein J2Y48_005022 [Mycoplana sp. BE70]|nr:hypothetical protein [Mycoplana sp. BE70]MDR6759704.1 hypothetical protein [Mycoplana sp. BE70]
MFSETLRLTYLNAFSFFASLITDDAIAQIALIVSLVFVVLIVLAF